MSSPDLSQFSMHDLFRLEVDGQREILTAGLLALERKPDAAEHLEACMRAAHSLKGAARIVGLAAAVTVAHAMEDCFVAAQQGQVVLKKKRIDQLFKGLDLLLRIAGTAESEAAVWTKAAAPEAAGFQRELAALLEGEDDAVAAEQAMPRKPVASDSPPAATAAGTDAKD
jgi:two-component system sensor histidine kinase and response regulator WspE